MNRNTWEIAFSEKFVKFGGSESALDENDNLVELKVVEEVIQLSVLLTFLKLDAVLLKTVKSKLGFVIDVNFEWVSHEFLANWSNLLRECGAEHHDLLLGRCSSEDLLNVAAHVYIG